MTLTEIQAQQQGLIAEMETIVQSAAENWQENYNAKMAQFNLLNSKAEALKSLQGLQPVETAVRSLPVDDNPQADPQKDHTSEYLIKAFRALKHKDTKALKTLQLTNTPLGGWMAQESVAQDILSALKPMLVFSGLGARMRVMVDDILFLRKRTTRANVVWQGESGTIAATDYLGTRITMTAKYAAAIITVSNRLLNSTAGTMVESDLRQELIEELQLAFEYAYLYGVGATPEGTGHTGSQPRGLANVPGINTFAIGADLDGSTNALANGGLITIEDLSKAMNMVERTNVPQRGTVGWIAHPVVKHHLRNLVDENGRHYFWESPADPDNASRIAGYPVRFTTQIKTDNTVGSTTNCTDMFFGYWGHFNIGTPMNLDLAATSESDTAFQQDETHYRIIAKTDCLPSYPEAFVRVTGVHTQL